MNILKFTKMHGAGNDYVYFDCTGGKNKEVFDNAEKLSILLSDRHFGVGGDGIVLICESRVADFRMRMFNNDGSEGKMCGNASYCIGTYVYTHGLTDKTVVTLETLSGIKTLTLDVAPDTSNRTVNSVTVGMGEAILKAADIPVVSDSETFINREIKLENGVTYTGTAVSMGNPHFVIFTENEITEEAFLRDGKLIEFHPAFPERVNTEFVTVLSRNKLKMRVWERGTGETLACGTGTCASAVAAVLAGVCDYDTEIEVQVRGGTLYIVYKKDGSVRLRGKGVEVFSGEYNLSEN